MSNKNVPITKKCPREIPRLQELREFYCSQFGLEPHFLVRVPGRVNLIGEHVDYCGYPVIPMALEQCIFLAVGYTDSDTLLQLRNLDTKKFKNFKCDLTNLKIDLPEQGSPEWYNYYLCGVKGIHETLGANQRLLGMTIAISGNIPPASGLSSSSALVSAAVLATAHVHRLPLERLALASISASCERYIGTQGGGMDQAIAYLAKAGCAQFIEFYPELKATPIQLPAGACFVVANSLAENNKAASADFNERVVECRLGARMMAKKMHINEWQCLTRFVQLQEALQCTLKELEDVARKCLPLDIYTRTDICAEFDLPEQQFENDFLTPNTRKMTKFKLRQRTLHVIQESLRVSDFRNTCEPSASNGNCSNGHNGNSVTTNSCQGGEPQSTKLPILSKLMRQSHYSLQNLYECSHPDLNRLIAISDAQQVGARLTGAGWGGCIVALCGSIAESQRYMQELKDKYFTQLPAHILAQHQHNNFADVVFATSPRSGAEIFEVPIEHI